jgi:hypothetical protein
MGKKETLGNCWNFFRFLMRILDFFFSLPNPPRHNALGFTHPLTEIIPETEEKMLLWNRPQPVLKADNLAICKPIV